MDADTDDDGLKDGEEILIHGTNVTNPDTENDGMLDGWEVRYALNPLFDDAAEDPDDDGLTNIEEFNYGTNPRNNDTDSDGYLDGEEIEEGYDPLDPNNPKKAVYEFFFVLVTIGVVSLLMKKKK